MLKYSLNSNIWLWPFILVYLIAAYIIAEYIYTSFKRDTLAEHNAQHTQQLSLVRANLEAAIHSDIFLAESLSTLVTVNPNSTPDEWLKLSAASLRNAKHIRNIAIAPNDVISFIHPLKGNEKALGLDYKTIPSQYETVLAAKKNKSIAIAGPLELVQGGVGLIGRVPVFIDPPVNQTYWGLMSVVLDVQSLFKSAGVYDLNKHANLAMRGVNGYGDEGQIFFGNMSTFNHAISTQTVRLPQGSWTIAISAHNSKQNNKALNIASLIRFVSYTLALILLVSFLLMYKAYYLAKSTSLQDELTYLANRRYAMQLLTHLTHKENSGNTIFTVLNLDIDKFKRVNDEYGHSIGDELLIEIAQRLRKSVRSSDTVARLGGDEFLIVLPRVADASELNNIIQNIKSNLTNTPFQHQQLSIPISISIGYACYPKDAIDLDVLLHKADRRMYEEKNRK